MAAAKSLVVAIGGGKGGVGKSLVSSNLAVAMAQAGRTTVLVDGDLGSPNLHSMLGVDKVKHTIASVLNHDVEHLDDTRTATAVPGLWLVAGASAAPGSANIPHLQKQRLMRHIGQIKADVVVVDTGAGTSFNTLDLFNVADVRLLVTTPQLTALQNAYAFAKSTVFRELRSLAVDKPQQELLDDPRLSMEAARMRSLVQQVSQTAPQFAEALRDALASSPLYVLGNCVMEERDANVFHAFSRMVKDFLSVDSQVVGQLRSSRKAHDSVNQRRPMVLSEPQTDFSLQLRAVADRLLMVDVRAVREGRANAQAKAERSQKEPPPAALPADLGEYARPSTRNPLALAATLDGQSVQVVDLSEDGVALRSGAELSVGRRGALAIAGHRSRAIEIRNAREGGVYGARFLEGAR